MTRFYTKTGDDGYTGLLGQGRVTKYDPLIETIGYIDEASAAFGIARSICKAKETNIIILTVQKDLYHVMTEIAVLPENSDRFLKLSSERISWLETQIEQISKNISIPKEFIVPGDSHAGATLDLVRTIVRRAERRIANNLHQGIITNSELLRYLNRLSSLCFVLELLENQVAGYANPTLAKD